jgi:hypothetical protein
VPVTVGYGQERLAREGRRASVLVEQAASAALFAEYREAVNILTQAIRREIATLESIAALGQSAETEAALARGRRQLAAVHEANLAALTERARAAAAAHGLAWRETQRPADEQRLASLVVARSLDVRGPVNIFRHEYGASWLAEKTGNPRFLEELAIARAGRYVWFEAINFVDGRRTMLEIRDLVSAEYGPIDAADVEQYFRLLERVGVVSIAPAAAR